MSLAPRLVRWTGAAGCLGLGAWLVTRSLGAGGAVPEIEGVPPAPPFLPVAGGLIGGILLAILGILALAPELAALASTPLRALVDAIYLPGGRADKPTLDLKLPAYYLQQDRPGDALSEYRKILRHHPGTLEAWTGALDLLAGPFADPAAARRLFARGRRRLRHDPEALAALEGHWRRLQERHRIR